jgi:hypothetical protein
MSQLQLRRIQHGPHRQEELRALCVLDCSKPATISGRSWAAARFRIQRSNNQVELRRYRLDQSNAVSSAGRLCLCCELRRCCRCGKSYQKFTTVHGASTFVCPRYCLTSAPRNDRSSSRKRVRAGSPSSMTWFGLSSGTKRAPGMPAAMRLPDSNGTLAS